MKKTKIVATIGPASKNKKILQNIIKNGMNVARLNFSHGDYNFHKSVILNIRKLSQEMNVSVGILADLQGPRIRVGNTDPFFVRSGEVIFVSDKKKGKRKELIVDCENTFPKFKTGDRILIEDGTIELKIISNIKGVVKAETLNDGIIKPRKGVNIPETKINFGALTQKDLMDLKFALRQEVDFVALSFVSNEKEIFETRQRMKKILRRDYDLPHIVAKIERQEAIKNLDKIIQATDAVMVARGDLGIEMDESCVAVLQKEIVEKSLRSGKAVIVATQMLGSMVKRLRPTRAEVSDVSNAVVDHTDAVMLSEETAMGKHPLMALNTMKKIIENTENSPYDDLWHGFLKDANTSVSAAVADAAHELSKNSFAKAIVVASITGFTARMIARHRPQQKIYVMTNNAKTYNQLSLTWGAESFILPDCQTLDELITNSVGILKERKLIKKKDKLVIVTGRPHVKKERMSLVKVEEVK